MIVLLERWPELGSAVRADPPAMARLEQPVDGPAEPLADIVAMLAPQVTVSSDLTAFLKSEPRFAPVVQRLIYCLPAPTTVAD